MARVDETRQLRQLQPLRSDSLQTVVRDQVSDRMGEEGEGAMSGTPRMTDEEFGRVCAILLDEKSGLIDYDDLNKWVAEARRAREAEAELRHEVAEAHGVAQACEQRAEKAEAELKTAREALEKIYAGAMPR